jgi:hypothetical protein
MSIDERLRAGLSANTEHLVPDLELDLARILRRAHRRRQLRVAGAAVLAAAVVVAIAWLGGVSGLDRASEHQGPIKHPKIGTAQPKSMEGINGPIEKGTWIVPFWGREYESLPRAVVDVPAGYGSPGGWVVDRGADGDPDSYGDVAFWTVAAVLRDPCEGVATDDPGPSVRDLADALRAQPGHRATRPRAVEVDGYSGLYLEVTLPGQERLSGCHKSQQTLWRTDAGDEYGGGIGGSVSRLWILDVDGTRVVMVAGTTPNETPDEVAEVLAIAASTRFIDPAEPAN